MTGRRKIAVWGLGFFGRKMLKVLREQYSDLYSVTAQFDRSPQKQGTVFEGMRIEDPELIKTRFAEGMFDSVMVCIKFGNARSEAVRKLNGWKIPAFFLGNEDCFYDNTRFQTEKTTYRIAQKGYDLWVFPHLLGTKALHFDSESLFLFDETGKLLKEQWDAYITAEQSDWRFYFPIRFDSLPGKRTILKGEWCVLTKLFAGNYWHFVNEGLDIVTLLEEAGYSGNYLIPGKDFCKELLLLMGVKEERICSALEFPEGDVLEFEKVVFCHHKEVNYRESADVLHRIGLRLQKNLHHNPDLPKRIHVKRVGSRKLLNEEKTFEQYGFAKVVPEEYSVKEQMELFYNAEIVLSEHGANSTNYLCMQPGTVFIETFNDIWKYPFNLYGTYELGIHYLPVSNLIPPAFGEFGKTDDYRIDDTLLKGAIENAIMIRKGESS